MLGFNDGIIPKYVDDTKYLTDNIRSIIGLNNIKTINQNITTKTINAINDIKNLTITYKLYDNKSSYYPSVLCENYEIIKETVNYNISYSDIYDKLTLAKSYDQYFKYGYKTDYLNLLQNNYQIAYNSYSNKYTKVNPKNDKLTLSYSKMQMYNKCAFHYYLTNVLKLDIYKENFSTIIG